MRYIILTLAIIYFSLPFLMGFAIPPEKPVHHVTYPITRHAYPSTVSDTIQILVEEGWNLISLPLIVPDNQVSVLFPNSVSNAFYYDGSYRPSDTLEVGKGYWLKFSAAETISVVGTLSTWDTLSLFPGWNMIGVIDYAVDINHLYTSPESKLISGFYTYDSGQYHQVTDSLLPGIGYWIKVSDSCLVYPNFGKGGRIRLQNEIEHSGIFIFLTQRDTTYPSDIVYMIMTDSLGYFEFDSLPDGDWKLVAIYAYYNGGVLPLSIFNNNFTRSINFELQQFFQFWSEPADTTVSIQEYFCISPRVYIVNLFSFTLTAESKEDCGPLNWGWIRTTGWPSDSCFEKMWCFYNGFCAAHFEMPFPPGDTFHFTNLNPLCREDIDSSGCFEGDPTGAYLIFSGLSDASYYPWFLDREHVLEGGYYYKPLYKYLNRSLSKKMNLFRPTIVNIIN